MFQDETKKVVPAATKAQPSKKVDESSDDSDDDSSEEESEEEPQVKKAKLTVRLLSKTLHVTLLRKCL